MHKIKHTNLYCWVVVRFKGNLSMHNIFVISRIKSCFIGLLVSILFVRYSSFVLNLQQPTASNIAVQSSSVISDDGLHDSSYIEVGDYIEYFGGVKWRVVAKDGNGIMIRTDRPTVEMPFDKPRPLNGDRLALNSVFRVTINGTGNTSDFIPDVNTHSRVQLGDNFYFDSDVHNYLYEFYDNLDQNEKDAIIRVQQEQNVSFADRFAESDVSSDYGKATLSIRTSGLVLNKYDPVKYPDISQEHHLDRVQPYDEQGLLVRGSNSYVTSTNQYTSVGKTDISLGDAMLNDYKKLPAILFDDPVFIPSWIQAFEIQHSRLRNAIGGRYSQVLKADYQYQVDANGNDIFDVESGIRVAPVWTRSPAIKHNNNLNFTLGTALLAHSIGNLEGTPMQAPQVGTNIFTNHIYAKDILGVTPTLYLSNKTRFEYFGKREYNPNEPLVTRDKQWDGDGGYRAWVVDGTTRHINNLVDQDFDNLRVGQDFGILLKLGRYTVTGELPQGIKLNVNNANEAWLAGVPTKVGQYSFGLSDGTDNVTFNVVVAKGNMNATIDDVLIAQTGDLLESIELPDIDYRIPSTLQWSNPKQEIGKSSGIQYYDVNLVPNDKVNWNTQQLRIKIDVKRNFATSDFVNLSVGKEFDLTLSGARYKLETGDLPDGLALGEDNSSSIFRIYGTPLVHGQFVFSISRQDATTPSLVHVSNIVATVAKGNTHARIGVLSGIIGNKLSSVSILDTQADIPGEWRWVDPDMLLQGEIGGIVKSKILFEPKDINWGTIELEVSIVLSQDKTVYGDGLIWAVLAGSITGLILIILAIMMIRRQKISKVGLSRSGGLVHSQSKGADRKSKSAKDMLEERRRRK
jgi:hypothetical protein